jgi:hypothetical protein
MCMCGAMCRRITAVRPHTDACVSEAHVSTPVSSYVSPLTMSYLKLGLKKETTRATLRSFE